jgi:Tol biopolymer transport system component
MKKLAEYGTCPFCSASVELTPKRRQLKAHSDRDGPCQGSGLRLRPVSSRKRRWSQLTRAVKVAYALVFTVIVGVLGILGYLGISPQSAPRVIIGKSPEQLVSSDSNGIPADGDSGRPSIDASGRYVAFTSDATNLSPAATNGHYNVYRKDRVTGAIYLASGGANGTEANGSSQFPVICANGTWIAFASTSTNLIAGGARLTAAFSEVYVKNAVTGQTTLVSVSGTTGAPADASSDNPRFSTDCSKIAFESKADNLAPGTSGNLYNIYVRDLRTGTTTIASVSSNGDDLNADSTLEDINGAGTMVAFTSWASNLPLADPGHPEIYVRSLTAHTTIAISTFFRSLGPDARGFSWPDFSPDGRYLIFRSLTDPLNVTRRGRYVLVWDIVKNHSSITSASGAPAGWPDACVTGINNGTDFSPIIADPGSDHSYRVLFTVARNGICNLVLRDLGGNDIPIDSEINYQQVLEPTINSSGDFISWDVASQPQLIYACKIDECT